MYIFLKTITFQDSNRLFKQKNLDLSKLFYKVIIHVSTE